MKRIRPQKELYHAKIRTGKVLIFKIVCYLCSGSETALPPKFRMPVISGVLLFYILIHVILAQKSKHIYEKTDHCQYFNGV